MTRKQASEYDPGLFELYDRYVQESIDCLRQAMSAAAPA